MSAQRISQPHAHERLDRKTLKAPDEFVVWTARAAAWARQHRTTVLAIAGAAAAVLLAAAFLTWQASRRADAAADAFRLASARFAGEQYAEAASEFEAVARDHAGTPFGRLAWLYRGHSLARQSQPAEAAAAYEQFLADEPEADYLGQIALTGLGRAREAAGDAAAARDAFSRAADLEGPYRIDALLGVARLAEAAGDAAAAEAAYRKVLDGDVDPDTRAWVSGKLPAAPAAGPDPATDSAPADAPAPAGDTAP